MLATKPTFDNMLPHQEPLIPHEKNVVDEAIDKVKESNLERRKAQKNIAVQAFKIGRYLKETIQPSLKHGEWMKWFKEHVSELGYDMYSDPIRRVQKDMGLWLAWRDWIDKNLPESDSPESDLVDALDQSGLLNADNFDFGDIAVSALEQFTGKNAIPEAQTEFINEVKQGVDPQAGTISRAKTIIKKHKALKGLTQDRHRQVAGTLMEQHELENPDIIEAIPTLADKFPTVMREMLVSGSLDVPGTEEPTPISSLGINDVKAVMGESGREKFLEAHTNSPAVTGYSWNYVDQLDFDIQDLKTPEGREKILKRIEKVADRMEGEKGQFKMFDLRENS